MGAEGAGRRRASLIGGALLLVLAVLAGRMLLSARTELRNAEAARQRGDGAARVRHLRRALAHYLPGNPYVRRAEKALLEEADGAEAAGDGERALEILHQLRSAVLSLRGLTHPFAADLPDINRRIAELSSRQPGAALQLRSRTGAEALRRRLDSPPEPSPLWAMVGLLGFVLWSGGGLLLCLLGLRPDASTVRERFTPLLAVVALGLLLFGLGMARA